MPTVETTEDFDAWHFALDSRTRVRIAARLAKLAAGLWGDCKVVGEGVTELREHFGPGWRIYVTRLGSTVVVVLGGGSKSTQQRDIQTAVAMARLARE